MTEIEELEQQVARIRAKRSGGFSTDKLRTVLNAIFLIGALVGVVVYFALPARHVVGLCIVGAAMVFKLAEFVVRLTK